MNKLTGIKSAKSVDSKVIIVVNGKTLSFEDCWLRDQCRCSTCYHADTFQRAVHILDIPNSKITQLTFEDSQLHLTWDDDHVSHYDASFLAQFDFKTWSEGNRMKPVLWQGSGVATKVARIHVDKFLNSVDGARAVFQSLLDYGVALFENVEPTLEATAKVCKALGGIQHTLFGGIWEFTTKADHADTAYTNLPLATHNDSTYFTESTGLQLLHCLGHSDGAGGETILADGFFGASCLKTDHPEDFQFLTTFDLEAEYIEEGHHHKHSAPVIKLNAKTGDLKQIRYNVYDRTAMPFSSSEECRNYYRSLKNLARYYEKPDNQWQFKLTPGLAVVFDNFRVLHGRTQFTGKRILCGSYVSRSDWLDRARTLKLIQ